MIENLDWLFEDGEVADLGTVPNVGVKKRKKEKEQKKSLAKLKELCFNEEVQADRTTMPDYSDNYIEALTSYDETDPDDMKRFIVGVQDLLTLDQLDEYQKIIEKYFPDLGDSEFWTEELDNLSTDQLQDLASDVEKLLSEGEVELEEEPEGIEEVKKKQEEEEEEEEEELEANL